jgi:hypothetical protein
MLRDSGMVDCNDAQSKEGTSHKLAAARSGHVVGWVEYEKHSPKLWVKFRPLRPIARSIEAQNRAEYANWKEIKLSEMPVPPNTKEPR